MNHHPTLRAILLMITSCLLFALVISLVRQLAETGMDSMLIVFLRNVMALLVMLPWVVFHGLRPLKTKRLKLYGVRGTTGVCAMMMWFYAIAHIPLSQGAAISFTSPIFGTILSLLFFGDKAGWHRWLAMTIGFSGVLIILRPDTDIPLGAFLALGAAFTWALSGIITKHLTATDGIGTIVFYMAFFLTIFSTPLGILYWQEPTLEQIFWLFLLGIVSNLAHIAASTAMRETDLSVILPFDFTRLVFVSIIAYFAFGEVVDEVTLLGSAVIVASSAYIANRERKKPKAVQGVIANRK